MSDKKFYIDESRKRWRSGDGTISREHLTLGCLMRIADSLEKMDKSWGGQARQIECQSDEIQRLNGRLGVLRRRAATYQGLARKVKK